MKNAIKKAIEGGWSPKGIKAPKKATDSYVLAITVSYGQMIFLDPLFWQALGKAMGWEKMETESAEWFQWKEEWHNFIDHLAERKDVNSFFRELL